MALLVKAGKPLCIQEGTGAYRRTVGFYVALRDFHPLDERDAFLAANPAVAEQENSADRFIEHLIASGLVLKAKFETLHLGPFGRIETATLDEA